MHMFRNPSLYVQFFHFVALGYMLWTIFSHLAPAPLPWDHMQWQIISFILLLFSALAGALLNIFYHKRKTNEDIFPFACIIGFSIGMYIALPQWDAFLGACVSALSFSAFWIYTDKQQGEKS